MSLYLIQISKHKCLIYQYIRNNRLHDYNARIQLEVISGIRILYHSGLFTDINECDMEGTCDQTCVNTVGSYYCQCLPGYIQFGHTHCAGEIFT